MSFFSHITTAFANGGIWMWAIFFAQMASLIIIVERVYALYFNRDTRNKDIAKGFEDDIRRGHIEKVISRAGQIQDPIGRIIQAGAQAALDLGGREEIQAKMDEILMVENAKLEKRTGFLATLGNVGTLIGLLGTVVGMISSFTAVASVNPIEKATMLANGISEAMHCTAYGLLMAIPAIVMYSVLQNRATAVAEDMNQAAVQVFNWLGFNYESVSRKKIRGA